MSRPDTWFRMYNAVLDNPKVQRLSDALFKAWVNLLCLASRCGGVLPSISDVAFALRVTDSKASAILADLERAGLFDLDETGAVTPHDWSCLQFKSDVSTDRVKRFRAKPETVSVTVKATPPEESRPEHTKTEQKEVVQKVVSSLSKQKSTWTREQRKAAWQGKICAYAERTMAADAYAAFLAKWAVEDPQAVKMAESIDRILRAEKPAYPKSNYTMAG
jgi:hypothetical protein